MNALAHLVEYLRQCVQVLLGLHPAEIAAVGWPLFVFDVPRYALTPWVTLFSSRKARRASGRAAETHQIRQLLENPPLVTVVVPAYNEGEHLRDSILSLKRQDYPRIEIIVIDDASTDETGRIADSFVSEGVRVVHGSTRQGKAFGHNVGLHLAKGDYLVVCDGDTVFAPNAITQVALSLADSTVGGVAGTLRVKNPKDSLLTRLQVLEYLFSIEVGRQFASRFGILHIVSGAFGGFRADAVRRLHGWEVSPGEDADMTKGLRKAGYRIAFNPRAVAYTDVPVTLRALFRQRLRWNRSIVLLNLRKHRDLLGVPQGRSRHRFKNLWSAWDILLYTVLLGSGAVIILGYTLVFHPTMMIPMLLFLAVCYTIIDLANYTVAMILSDSRKETFKLLPMVPFLWLYMGIVLRVIMFIAIADEFLFRSSYRDPYVPSQISRIKPRWGEREPFLDPEKYVPAADRV